MKYKELLSTGEIQRRVHALGEEIDSFYNSINEPLLVVGLLRGSFIFMADLVRAVSHDLETDFMTVSSYGNAQKSSGEVKIIMDLSSPIEGRHVLLVEDIVDSGNTFHNVIELLKHRSPASIKVATLLNKPSRREVEVPIDFCGFEIPDHFVFGMGLDYEQLYRNLPFVAVKE